MNKKTANEQEVKKFSDMASEWWDPNGKFSPLHKFNPVRQEYLIDKISSHFSLIQNAFLKILNFGKL